MVDLRAEPVHLCHLTSLQDFHAECLSPGRSLGRESSPQKDLPPISRIYANVLITQPLNTVSEP